MESGQIISWCSAMSELRRMNEDQFRRARKLIRRLCANYDGGNCLPLDDGDPCPCPQLISPTLICKYFRAAVLPADRELCAEVLGGTHVYPLRRTLPRQRQPGRVLRPLRPERAAANGP